MSKDLLDVADDLGRLNLYVGRANKMLSEQVEPLCKEIGGDVCDGYIGLEKDLGWMLSDIQDMVNEVRIVVDALRGNSSSIHAPGSPLIPVFQEGKPANPAMLSGSITRLQALLAKHGDMAVLVEGNELTKVEPMIWIADDQAVAGEELRNCVFLS